MNALDAFLSIPKDTIPRELFLDYKEKNKSKNHQRSSYRYDYELNLLYKERVTTSDKSTYIMKSCVPDLYKVGHSANLSKRFKSIRNTFPYSLLDLKPLAVCGEDVESKVIGRSGCWLNARPHPFEKCEELLYVSGDDLQFILDYFGFSLINEGEEYPTTIKKITRDYYDPIDGRHIHTRIVYENQL